MRRAWIVIHNGPEFLEDGKAEIHLTEPSAWYDQTVIPIVYDKLDEDEKKF